MYAIAKFGSNCRDDSDQHSDRDLLIVCPPRKKASLQRKYNKKGFSVSFFTESQLERMQDKGSLFLQHIKFESRIVIDSDDEFRRFIDSCNFKPPSQDELDRCEIALTTVLTWPSDSRTDSWKADWLYCVLRDYLVKKLAARGSLAFGISDISRCCKMKWGATDAQLNCLAQLRLNKAYYRSGVKEYTGNPLIFSEVNSLIKTISGIEISISSDHHRSLESLRNSHLNTCYQWLRALEGIYILARSTGFTHPSHEEIVKIIQNPNLYNSSSQLRHKSVQNYYTDVLAVLITDERMQTSRFQFPRAEFATLNESDLCCKS